MTKERAPSILHKIPNKNRLELPWWKQILLLALLASLGFAVYYIYNGKLIQVLTFLTLLFLLSGIFLVISYLVSKELFLWLIGRRSEYQKLIGTSQTVAIGLSRAAINYFPMGLTPEEKERLKNDVPVFLQMRFMQGINNFIARIFIGAFAAAFGLLGTTVLMKQNEKLDLQNEKIEVQNNRIIQQTYLQEADRRSSLIFLFSDVINDMNAELSQENRTLSNALIGRIVNLSRAFKPYYYLDGDSLTTKLKSPERGQLLLALLESELDTQTYKVIFQRSDFSYAELEGFDLSFKYLDWINLKYAHLDNANFENSSVRLSNLSFASCKNANFQSADLTLSDLIGTNFTNANLIMAILNACNATSIVLDSADIRGSDLKSVLFENGSFVHSDMSYASFSNKWSPTYLCEDKYVKNKRAVADEVNLLLRLPEFKNKDPETGNFGSLRTPYGGMVLPTTFKNADLRNAKIENSDLHHVRFIDSKMDSIKFCSSFLLNTKFENSVPNNGEFNYTILGIENFNLLLNIQSEYFALYVLPNQMEFFKIAEKRELLPDSLIKFIGGTAEIKDFSKEFCLDLSRASQLYNKSNRCSKRARAMGSPGDSYSIVGEREKMDSVYQNYLNCDFATDEELDSWFPDIFDDKTRSQLFNHYSYIRYLSETNNSSFYYLFNKPRRCKNCLRLFKINNINQEDTLFHIIPDISVIEGTTKTNK